MAVQRLTAGVHREIWRDTDLLGGGASVVVPTGIRANAASLPQVFGVLILQTITGTPEISASLSIVSGRLVVTITNAAAAGNSASWKLDVTLHHSIQQGRDPTGQGAIYVVNAPLNSTFVNIASETIAAGGAATIDVPCTSAGRGGIQIVLTDLLKQRAGAYLQADAVDGNQERTIANSVGTVAGERSQRVWLTRPTSGLPRGDAATGAEPFWIAVKGTVAYVSNFLANTVQSIDFSDPDNPVTLDTLAVGLNPGGLAISGNTLFLVEFGTNTLRAIDITNPAAMASLGTVATGVEPYAVAVSGTTAFVLNYSGNTLQSFNVANPAAMVSISTLATGAAPIALELVGTTLYLVAWTGGTLEAYNVANPAAMVLLGSVPVNAQPDGVALIGTTAFVVSYGADTIQSIDVSNPAVMAVLDTEPTGNHPGMVAVSGNMVYVTAQGNNWVETFNAVDPADLVGYGALSTGLGSNPNVLTVAGNLLLVGLYSSATLRFVDISTAQSVQLDLIPQSGAWAYHFTAAHPSGWGWSAAGVLPAWTTKLTITSLDPAGNGLLAGGTIEVFARSAPP